MAPTRISDQGWGRTIRLSWTDGPIKGTTHEHISFSLFPTSCHSTLPSSWKSVRIRKRSRKGEEGD
jgi:hypothetical protein